MAGDRSPTRVSRTTDGLREALFLAIEGVLDGTVRPEAARAIASGAQAIVQAARVDLEAQAKLAAAGIADEDARALKAPALRLGVDGEPSE